MIGTEKRHSTIDKSRAGKHYPSHPHGALKPGVLDFSMDLVVDSMLLDWSRYLLGRPFFPGLEGIYLVYGLFYSPTEATSEGSTSAPCWSPAAWHLGFKWPAGPVLFKQEVVSSQGSTRSCLDKLTHCPNHIVTTESSCKAPPPHSVFFGPCNFR